MKTRTVLKRDLEHTPWLIWNAFIDLLATEKYEALTPEQRPAHLVFWYESEVQNGGHLQYFENRGVSLLAETIVALRILGAECQRQVFCDASEVVLGKERSRIRTAEEYCTLAIEGEFDDLDSRFHSCSLSLIGHLEKHLALNQPKFVVLT